MTNMITYPELLEELEANSLEDNPIETHLLLGNGFNLSLGVYTDYQSIFSRMLKERPHYKHVKHLMEGKQHDIERLMKLMDNKVSNDKFLKAFVGNKIKFDFMKATYSIVKDNVKKIHEVNNQEVHLLLKNFTNYFTLNFDPFLYLLLMKFKSNSSSNEMKAVAFQRSSLFPEKSLDKIEREIYKKVSEFREHGRSIISPDGNLTLEDLMKSPEDGKPTVKELMESPKMQFISLVKDHFEYKNWKDKNIKNACDLIWKIKKDQKILDNTNDAFLKSRNILLYKPTEHQNVFFLHGSFHLQEDKNNIVKITQKHDKPLYERLDAVINSEEKNILCVLKGTSKEKVNEIENNAYLKHCYEKLFSLQGRLVILGSSLGDSDRHIFDAINDSSISDIYVSTCEDERDDCEEKSQQLFPNKNVVLFDYTTISYEPSDD